MVWQNNWRVETFQGTLTQRVGETIADRMNQFFALNPCITCLQLEASWEFGSSKGQGELFVNLHLTNPYGIRYYAAEFQSTSTQNAAAFADDFFNSNPNFQSVLMKDITSPETRYIGERLLVIYALRADIFDQDLFMVRSAVPGNEVLSGETAGAIDGIDASRNAFQLVNIGPNAWPEGVGQMALKYPGYGNLWAGIGPSIETAVPSDDVVAPVPDCTSPDGCPGQVPPTTFPTTTLPRTTPPPTVENPCHLVEWKCICNSSDESEWELVSDECVDDSKCLVEGTVINCSDSKLTYQKKGACVGGVKPATPPTNKANGDPCEPSCCGTEESLCHRFRYDCKGDSDNESNWVLTENECKKCTADEENCIAGPNGNITYIRVIEDGCNGVNPPAAPAPRMCEAGCVGGWKILNIAFAEGNTACTLTANGLFDADCQPYSDLNTAVRNAMDTLYAIAESGGGGCVNTFVCCDIQYRTLSAIVVGALGIVSMDFDDEVPPDDYNDGFITVNAERC